MGYPAKTVDAESHDPSPSPSPRVRRLSLAREARCRFARGFHRDFARHRALRRGKLLSTEVGNCPSRTQLSGDAPSSFGRALPRASFADDKTVGQQRQARETSLRHHHRHSSMSSRTFRSETSLAARIQSRRTMMDRRPRTFIIAVATVYAPETFRPATSRLFTRLGAIAEHPQAEMPRARNAHPRIVLSLPRSVFFYLRRMPLADSFHVAPSTARWPQNRR